MTLVRGCGGRCECREWNFPVPRGGQNLPERPLLSGRPGNADKIDGKIAAETALFRSITGRGSGRLGGGVRSQMRTCLLQACLLFGVKSENELKIRRLPTILLVIPASWRDRARIREVK